MKLLLLSALCALSFQATAQTYGVGVGYEHDSATSNTRGLKSVAKASVLAGVRTSYGQFDTGVYEVTIRGERFFDTQQGVEVGYTNGFAVGPVRLSGRAGAGKVFGRGLGAPSDTGYYNTYAVTAALPITKQFAVSLAGRYRPERDFSQQQQYSAGVSYSFSKNLTVLGTVRHTRSTGPILNGASVTALYFF